ncbi:MAG: DUF3800 domain-containing protein [Verrucomicrobiota bacterium]
MDNTFNVYCDESCHLEHDHIPIMVLGAVWCPLSKVKEITTRIRQIKADHGIGALMEIKWTKVSGGKLDFYQDLVDYFIDSADLHFRALIVRDKSKLDHPAHNQTHDQWYYKMYFTMLKVILDPEAQYRIYVDIKDTRGREKIRKLHEVLRNDIYDFSSRVIERVQLVRSHEVEILGLTDLLIGAVAYANRNLAGNTGKEQLIARIKGRTHYGLNRSTLLREGKFNLFFWDASEEKE